MPVIRKAPPPPFKVELRDFWIEFRYPRPSELRACLMSSYVDGKPMKGGGHEQELDPIKYHQAIIRTFAIGWGGFMDEAGQPEPFAAEALEAWMGFADPMDLVHFANAVSAPAKHLREVAEAAGKASAGGQEAA